MKRARVTEENAYAGALDRLTGADKLAQPPPVKETLQPASAMIKLSVFLNRQ